MGHPIRNRRECSVHCGDWGRYRSPASQLVSPLLLQSSYGQFTLERRAILNLTPCTILPRCYLNFSKELDSFYQLKNYMG